MSLTPDETPLPRADLTDLTAQINASAHAAARVYLDQAEVAIPSNQDVWALAEKLYRAEAHFRKWERLSPDQLLTYYERALELLLAQAAAEEFDRRQDAKLEILARALLTAHNDGGPPPWEGMTPPGPLLLAGGSPARP